MIADSALTARHALLGQITPPPPPMAHGVMARARFGVCVHCDLDLRDMTLGQGQQLCEL